MTHPSEIDRLAGDEDLFSLWEGRDREPYTIVRNEWPPVIPVGLGFDMSPPWQMHPVLGCRPSLPPAPPKPLTKRQKRRLRGKAIPSEIDRLAGEVK